MIVLVLAAGLVGAGAAFGASAEGGGAKLEAEQAPAISPEAEEIVSKRTATSDTYELPGGGRETRISEAPINYRDAEGKWQPITEGFRYNGGAIEDRSHPFSIQLPSHMGAAPVRFGSAEHWISFELAGAESGGAELEPDGAVSYEVPRSGTSFEYATLPSGVKETIELAGPSSPATIHYRLSAAADITPELAADGSIEFREGAGKAVAVMPAPTVADASSTVPEPGHATYSLSPQGNGTWSLAVEVDRSWLEAPNRAWPAQIDPTVYETGAVDCTLIQERPSESYCWEPLIFKAWTLQSNEEVARSLLSVNLSGIPANSAVKEASVSLWGELWGTTTGVEIRRVTKAWGSTASWNNAFCVVGCAPWTTPGGDFNSEGAEVLTSERGTATGWWTFSKGLAPVFQGWVGGNLQAGLMVKQKDEGVCPPPNYFCGLSFLSYLTSEPSKRPIVRVVYWPPAPATSKVISPTEGLVTARRLKLKSKWTSAGVTGVFYEFREGKSGPFEKIPVELVRKGNGEAISKWPVPTSGFESEPLYFDAAHATSTLRKKGGTIEVRAVFEGPAEVEGYSAPVEAKVNRFIGGPKDATTEVGPGSIDLLTGNLSVYRKDVSIPGFTSSLEFGRTLNSRGLAEKGSAEEAAENKSVLGPGWKPGVPVEEAGGSAWKNLKLETFNATTEEGDTYPIEYAVLTGLEGSEFGFEKLEGGGYQTPPEATGWSLTTEGSAFVLSDPGGNRTIFENPGGGIEYVPTRISQAGGSGNTTRIEYELPEGKKRVHMVVAPTAAGVTNCVSQAEATSNPGCHALVFTYASATTWGAPAADGERLSKITYYAPGNGGPWDVAQYKYNEQGRLIEEWDPRVSPALPEKYSYTSGGQIATLKPAGQEAWTMEYGAIDEEEANGRVMAVSRPSLLSSPSVAKTTIAYGVAVSGAGAPYPMGGSTVAEWRQRDVPLDATAIFPPSEVPASPPTSWAQASVYYMDAEGHLVNVAKPKAAGASGPSISTTETDEFGNVVRELTPQNRLLALAESSEAKRISRSEELDTHRLYSADGTQMEEEWGPAHQVRLETGTVSSARFHKVIQYDKGWPGTGVKPHLPTRETTGALVGGEVLDQRVTETVYNWELRKPVKTIVNPGGGTNTIESVMAYDKESGLPVETRQPKEQTTEGVGGSGPGTITTIYYKATGTGECENAPRYANLPCKVGPAAQTSGTGRPELPVKRFLAYNALGEPTETTESPGGKEEKEKTRKTFTTYDESGRRLTQRVEGGGVTVPKSETVYSATLGLPVKQRFVCEGSECGEGSISYQSSFGSSGTGNGQFAHSAGIAITSSGAIWVVDENNNRVEKFSEAGAYQSSFGSSGTGNGQFSRPTDIAIDAKGDLWVTDAGNNRIEEFNEKGEYLAQFGSSGAGNGQFHEPESIAIANGHVWVGDTYNHRLQEFNESREFIKTVSSNGSGAGQMVEPTGVAIGPGNKVWVADWGNQRVEEFTEGGEFVRQFGSEGAGNGQFKRPDVIDVDSSGNVWVGDQNNERVQEFNQSGEYVNKFGSSGTGAGQFTFGWPMGLATAGSNIWVSDTGNNRVEKWTITAGSFDSQASTATYDALGRVTEYEDADGNVARTTYDIDGRPITTSDNKGSETVTYDPASGLPTKLEASEVGTFTASYNADGNQIERTLPDGLAARTSYNEAAEPTALTYTKASNCGASCTWYEENLELSIYGQIAVDATSLVKDTYSYDKVGRLTLAAETPSGGTCTTRAYGFDADSNRLALTTRGAGIGGACNTEAGGTTQKYSYDHADRLEGEGLVYDSFGRITNLPAEFAGGKALTTKYFSNEMVAEQVQNGVTNSFTLDAIGRQRSRLQAGGLEGTEIFHYDGGNDAPAWTERGSTWTRNILGLGGELVAIQDSGSGTTLLLSDLRGNVVATAEPSPTATKLKATFRFDEFGDPVSGSAGRYGWLGAKQRRTELASGVIQMGVRSYVPEIGRFLSTDPVAGGSANAYDYANADPVNGLDLAGTKPWAKSQVGPCKGDLHVYSPKNYGGKNGYGKFYARYKVDCGTAGPLVHVNVLKVTRTFTKVDSGEILRNHSAPPENGGAPHWQGEWGNFAESKKPTQFGCLNGVEYSYTYEIQVEWASIEGLAAGPNPGSGTLTLTAQEVCGHGPY